MAGRMTENWSTEPGFLTRTESCSRHDTRSKIEPAIALYWCQTVWYRTPPAHNLTSL